MNSHSQFLFTKVFTIFNLHFNYENYQKFMSLKFSSIFEAFFLTFLHLYKQTIVARVIPVL